MGKIKRKRKIKPPPDKRNTTSNIPSQNFRNLSAKLTNLNRWIGILSFVPAIYVVLDFRRVLDKSKTVMLLSISMFVVLAVIKIKVQMNTLQLFNRPNPLIHQKFRRAAVSLLALSIFMFLVLAIPILYVHGYVSQFSNWIQQWLPARQKIGEKSSLAIAFVLGAIVSGVLGNLAYDILKWAVKNKLKKD
jgi:hypothetical protein